MRDGAKVSSITLRILGQFFVLFAGNKIRLKLDMLQTSGSQPGCREIVSRGAARQTRLRNTAPDSFEIAFLL